MFLVSHRVSELDCSGGGDGSGSTSRVWGEILERLRPQSLAQSEKKKREKKKREKKSYALSLVVWLVSCVSTDPGTGGRKVSPSVALHPVGLFCLLFLLSHNIFRHFLCLCLCADAISNFRALIIQPID